MLNDLIIIEKRKTIINPNGFEESIWEKELSCWACREKIVTTEEYVGQSYRTQIETTYKVRKSSNTNKLDTTEYRVIHKGNVQDIRAIIEDGAKGEFLKIQCKMVS